VDWPGVERHLLEQGYAHVPSLLTPQQCRAIREGFDNDAQFRSHVVMERHNFGKGEYKYFAYALPHDIATLRREFYVRLAPVANVWNERLKRKERFPADEQLFLEICSEHGQLRPTPLLLRYRAGDYNCLHEDTYGETSFPFQMTVFLSARDEYEGGEFVLVEQRPRMQSRPIVLQPEIGDAIVIPNRYRPVQGRSGYYRTTFRHGVSTVHSGQRYALGIIFHDAR
jgi:hypothetical protein